jgi:uncharacterized membrane protein
MHAVSRLWRSPSFQTGLWLGLLLCAAAAWSAPAAQYEVTVLGTGIAHAIDPITNEVVGDQFQPQQVAAILSGASRSLGTLPEGTFSNALAVHNGRVCGVSSTGRFALLSHAFLAEADGTLVDLGTAGGPDLFSSCQGLNDAKAVGFGTSPDDNTTRLPLVFQDGAVLVRPTLGGRNGSIAAVNAAGDECGESDTADGTTHATCWFVEDFSAPVDLDPGTERLSFAEAVAQTRRVVGMVIDLGRGARGFVWDPDTGVRVLDPLPGDALGEANDVNSSGDVVGGSRLPDPAQPALLHQAALVYGDDGVPIDLSTRVGSLPEGCTFRTAVAISDDGSIVVNGTCAAVPQVFLLTPVPGVAEAPLVVEASPAVEGEPAVDEALPVVEEPVRQKMRHRQHGKGHRRLAEWLECHAQASPALRQMVHDAMIE